MKIKHLALAGSLAAGIAGALWATGHLDLGGVLHGSGANAKATAANEYKPPNVTVITPRERAFVETTRMNGSLVAREEVLIAPQVEGQRIIELLAERFHQGLQSPPVAWEGEIPEWNAP